MRWLLGIGVLVILFLVWLLLADDGRSRGARGDALSAGSTPTGEARAPDENVGHSAQSPVARLRVVVLANGAPIAGADVGAAGPERHESWSRLTPPDAPPTVRGTTDDRGIAVLMLPRFGEWSATARARGFAPASSSAVLLNRDATLTLHLTRGCRLTGHVLDDRGQPVADATVRAGFALIWGPGRSLTTRTQTDADGRYELVDLPPGRLQIAAGDPASAPVFVTCPFVGELDLVLRPRALLIGRITDIETGLALAGAMIRVEAVGGTAHDVTDADGIYRCPDLPPGKVTRIAVRMDGYAPRHPSGVVGPADSAPAIDPIQKRGRTNLAIPIGAGATTRYDIALRRSAALTGTVRGPDGPVAGAKVIVTTGIGQNGYFVPAVESDANGRYEFAGIMAGHVLVHAEAPGLYDPATPGPRWKRILRESGGARVLIPTAGVITRDIELRAGAPVRGRAESADGTPLEGVLIHAHQALPFARNDSAYTRADGTFEFTGFLSGHPVRIAAGRNDHVLTGKPSIKPPDTEVVLKLAQLPRVRGTVRDESGAPLAGVTVEILQEAYVPSPRRVHDTGISTDADGRFSIFARSPDKHFNVRARAAGFVASTSRRREPGRNEYEVDITLRRGFTLKGLVTDAGGEPVAGAQIRAAAPGSRGYSWHAPIIAVSGADGTFRVDALSGPRIRLFVSAIGYVPADETLDANRAAHVRLKRARTIRGRVQLRDGGPAANVTVGAVAANDKRWDLYWISSPGALRSDGTPGRIEARTDAQGRFELADLSAVTYRLQIVPGGSGQRVRPVREYEVHAGADQVVVVVEPTQDTSPYATLADEELGRAARYQALLGKYKAAAKLWRALLDRLHAGEARLAATLELAAALHATGEHAEAETLLRDAIRAAPATNPLGLMLRYRLALTLQARGKTTQARAQLERVETAAQRLGDEKIAKLARDALKR